MELLSTLKDYPGESVESGKKYLNICENIKEINKNTWQLIRANMINYILLRAFKRKQLNIVMATECPSSVND